MSVRRTSSSACAWYVDRHPRAGEPRVPKRQLADGDLRLVLTLVPEDRLRRILARMFDPDEFLSDYGIRSISRYYLDHPYELRVGDQVLTVKYEPAESSTGMFGGNSNWRGPIWMPTNLLLVAGCATCTATTATISWSSTRPARASN